jgi:hypothetical protein
MYSKGLPPKNAKDIAGYYNSISVCKRNSQAPNSDPKWPDKGKVAKVDRQQCVAHLALLMCLKTCMNGNKASKMVVNSKEETKMLCLLFLAEVYRSYLSRRNRNRI